MVKKRASLVYGKYMYFFGLLGPYSVVCQEKTPSAYTQQNGRDLSNGRRLSSHCLLCKGKEDLW